MKVEVLGNEGCGNCAELEKRAREAATREDGPVEVEKVTDLEAIAARGLMSLPALVVDGEVVARGRVPQVDEITDHLS